MLKSLVKAQIGKPRSKPLSPELPSGLAHPLAACKTQGGSCQFFKLCREGTSYISFPVSSPLGELVGSVEHVSLQMLEHNPYSLDVGCI